MISFLPKYRVKYYDYKMIVKRCGEFVIFRVPYVFLFLRSDSNLKISILPKVAQWELQLRNINPYTRLTVYQTTPFQTTRRRSEIDLVNS